MFKRLDITKIDFTKKENQTLRHWFALMWQNSYIQLFIFGLAAIVGVLCLTFDNASIYIVLFIPIIMCLVIGYKGFYQFWEDMKKGTSR